MRIRIDTYGIYISATSEQARNDIVAALWKAPNGYAEMPCGAIAYFRDLESRWYSIPCPCLSTRHVLVEVRKVLTYGIGEGI